MRLLAYEVALGLRVSLRERVGLFAMLFFPLAFFALFNFVSGAMPLPDDVDYARFLTPGIIAFTTISSCFVGLATGSVYAREQGVFKRLRGTPVPVATIILARVTTVAVLALLPAAAVLLASAVFYDVTLVWGRLPGTLAAFLLGAACFSALGFAVTAAIPSTEAAPAVTNAVFFPLVIFSGAFFPLSSSPGWMRALAAVSPVGPFVRLLQGAFDPALAEPWRWQDVATLFAWAVVAGALALRFFRWEGRGEQRRAVRRRRRGEAEASPVALGATQG